jgi:hypothetical protein
MTSRTILCQRVGLIWFFIWTSKSEGAQSVVTRKLGTRVDAGVRGRRPPKHKDYDKEKCATLIKEAQALIAGLKTEIAELGTQLG